MKGQDLVKKYQEVWNEYIETSINNSTSTSEDNLLDRGFVFQFDENQKNIDILFVGINPSYGGDKSKGLFYSKKDVENLNYFKPFNNIIKELDDKRTGLKSLTWSHLDMLVFRETQQSFIKNQLLKTEEGNKFINKQLTISKQILEYLNPKIMVVSNTAARHFLGRDKYEKKGKNFGVWMGYDFEFDYSLGTDKIINNSKINSYVFFSSMLSGQRALDNGSKQRLIWHIDNILNKIT
ncbi:hypothetical protein V1T75_09160 [Tenacibaculum sp. FZY0031]|uniref:hypothetical protein n=1 Tax=Tenacibaculum sp. FZY0031 TaxID=3116648 RepID=UPI002ECB1199|nr:hypothetical protein [Tenacibaculum sp. FZY0031]